MLVLPLIGSVWIQVRYNNKQFAIFDQYHYILEMMENRHIAYNGRLIGNRTRAFEVSIGTNFDDE